MIKSLTEIQNFFLTLVFIMIKKYLRFLVIIYVDLVTLAIMLIQKIMHMMTL